MFYKCQGLRIISQFEVSNTCSHLAGEALWSDYRWAWKGGWLVLSKLESIWMGVYSVLAGWISVHHSIMWCDTVQRQGEFKDCAHSWWERMTEMGKVISLGQQSGLYLLGPWILPALLHSDPVSAGCWGIGCPFSSCGLWGCGTCRVNLFRWRIQNPDLTLPPEQQLWCILSFSSTSVFLVKCPVISR